jgi:Tfp pilus assembly protein PilO
MAIPRIRLLLAAVLSIGILALGWILGVAPQLEAAALARADRASVEAQNEVHRARIVELQAQFARIDETRAELAALQLQIPEGSDLPGFVDELTAIATAHNVQVTKYTAEEPLSPLAVQAAIAPPVAPPVAEPAPTEPAPAESTPADDSAPADVAAAADAPAPDDAARAASSTTTTTNITTPTENLFAIPVSLSLSGTDLDVRAMLADLEAGPRLFFVTSAKIVAQTDEGTGAGSEQGVSEVRGFVYVVPHTTTPQVTEAAPLDATAAAGDGANLE